MTSAENQEVTIAFGDFHINFFRSIYNKTVSTFGFVISRIIKVSVRVIDLGLRLLLIDSNLELHYSGYYKTSSDNGLELDRPDSLNQCQWLTFDKLDFKYASKTETSTYYRYCLNQAS